MPWFTFGDEIDSSAKRLLKGEMQRRGVSYAVLAKRLSDQGEADTEANVRNRINRGNFTATFLIKCLLLMGSFNLQLSEVVDLRIAVEGGEPIALKPRRVREAD